MLGVEFLTKRVSGGSPADKVNTHIYMYMYVYMNIHTIIHKAAMKYMYMYLYVAYMWQRSTDKVHVNSRW